MGMGDGVVHDQGFGFIHGGVTLGRRTNFKECLCALLQCGKTKEEIGNQRPDVVRLFTQCFCAPGINIFNYCFLL